MRILFIGGTGNISTECAELLHERGHEILVVSRGRNSVPREYRAIQADRKDLAGMRAALKGAQPEIVLNFLGYELADVQLDYELFKCAIRQYVFISSATVYTKPARKLPITEDAPLGNPLWDYAQKKLECENWLRERKDFPVTIVRPSHTYSKIWVPNPVASSSFTFAARLGGGKPVFVPDDGENPWTLTATSDFAVGLAGLIGKTEAIGEALHITSDEVLTWNQIYAEIYEALAEGASCPAPTIVKISTDFICQHAPELTGNVKGDKSLPGVFDNSKIKRSVPEFECRKPFRVGVRESVSWLRAHPEQQNLKAEWDAMFDRVIEAWRGRAGTEDRKMEDRG
jgi:nucleoside-diphosphate-sugar epimerase